MNNNPKQLPPALRKTLPKRPKGEISDSFAPITPATRPPSAPSPTPAPVAPAQPSSAPAPTPALRKSYTPKSAPAANPRIAPLEGRVAMFAGTFQPEGNDIFEAETPLTGVPIADRQALINAARKLFPRGGLKLKSTRIYTKEIGTPEAFPKGANVGQLFGEAGSATEASLEIGSVFHGGEKCQVVLVNLRSRNAVTINLRPPGGGKISFSNHISATTPAETLKSVVKEVLGSDARELEITLRVAK